MEFSNGGNRGPRREKAALGVAPGSAVYLDDYAGNVAAACRLGMQGVLVGEDYRAALAELETLLEP